ncbi:hypothetical protein WL860_24665 [Escherichia coli]
MIFSTQFQNQMRFYLYQGGYIVASNERARDSVLIDEGMNDFKVFSDGASKFIGISKKLQKYPDLYVHYFINLNHLDFFLTYRL